MVRISSTGDILPDDPNVNRRNVNSNNDPNGSGFNQGNRGTFRHENYNQQEQAAMQGERGQVSIFTALNERLLALGIPRWNAGSFVIEPIVSVGFLLAGLFLGLPGLLMGVVLLGVVKLSQSGGIPGQDYFFGLGRNQNNSNRRSDNRNNGNNKWSGGGSGHRLGRS